MASLFVITLGGNCVDATVLCSVNIDKDFLGSPHNNFTVTCLDGSRIFQVLLMFNIKTFIPMVFY